MAVFTTPFTTPGNYTYDTNKILVSGGVAALREDFTDVYGLWHLNELTGGIAFDSSGNGRDGTLQNMENADWVGAKLNNGLLFDGSNESVDLGDIANFEYTQPFSVECWFATSGTGAHVMMSRMNTTGTSRGWMLYIQAGLIKFIVRNSGTPGYHAWVQTANTFHDGAFHHVVATYNGSGITAGMHIYVDNVDQSLGIVADTLGDRTIVNSGGCSLGSRNNTNLYFVGTLDENVLYDRVLTVPEVSYRYNSNVGREDVFRYTDSPAIYKTAPHTGTVASYSNFSVTDGITEGSKGFQLSDDGGTTWKYWNGSSWVVAGTMDYNIAAVVNTNIASFPSAPDSIVTKTFLISNGVQREEIDEIQITYAENLNPTVDAGTNKEVFDNQFLTSFSDTTFSDADGTVDHAYYKVDGEVDIWTEILQGGYGTLLEAVQAFSYQFNNLGSQTVRLQVEDNVGGTNEDFLLVEVNKYTKTVNIRDVVTGDHIINFDFNPGDGSGTAQKDSPFVWSWGYGNFDTTIEKIFFYVKEETIFVENEDDLNIYIQASAFLNESKAAVGLMTENDRLSVVTWLQQGGQLITDPTSCTIELYDQDEVLRYTDNTDVHDEGHFNFSKTPSGLPNEGVYHLEVTVIAGGVPFTSVIPVGLVERKLISFEGAVHIDTETGVTGTVFPRGTPGFPVDNWADAKSIADASNLNNIRVIGDLTVGAKESIAGYTIRGESAHVATITLNGGSTLNTSFVDIEIAGNLNGACHIHHCHMKSITGFSGHVHGALIYGPITLNGETVIGDSSCGTIGGNYVEINLDGKEFKVHRYAGMLKLKGKTDTGVTELYMASGRVEVDSTCVAGTIVVNGVCDEVVDNSGPNCTVIRSLLQDLYDEALGEWVLDPDARTLTLYRIDGSILRVMDLTSTTRTLPSFIGRTPQ